MSNDDPEKKPCKKCGSQISTAVERCPECGYEPSNSTLSKLALVFLTLPFGLVLFGLVGAVALAAVGGAPILGVLGGFLVIGLLGLFPFIHITRYVTVMKMKPTQDPNDL